MTSANIEDWNLPCVPAGTTGCFVDAGSVAAEDYERSSWLSLAKLLGTRTG